ncbi:MAG: hypothetical protein HOP15_13740, partial [Planctomycetes bacterium]|nr:hypothetical protein [Planctomycetota bacterium]
MIRVSEAAPWDAGLYPEPARAAPWSAERPAHLAFATLWCTGGDPERDSLVRVQALRQAADGRWDSFAAFCRSERAPSDTLAAEHVGARLAREFGLSAADLDGAPEAARALEQLHAFLDGRTVITAARHQARNGWRARAGAPALAVLDLAEIAALCL